MENSYSKANIALTQNQIEFISCLFNDTEGVLSYPMSEDCVNEENTKDVAKRILDEALLSGDKKSYVRKYFSHLEDDEGHIFNLSKMHIPSDEFITKCYDGEDGVYLDYFDSFNDTYSIGTKKVNEQDVIDLIFDWIEYKL